MNGEIENQTQAGRFPGGRLNRRTNEAVTRLETTTGPKHENPAVPYGSQRLLSQPCRLPSPTAPCASKWNNKGPLDSVVWLVVVSVTVVRCATACSPESGDRLVGLVVKVSASREEDPGFESRLGRDVSGVEPVTSKLALQWLPSQAPGVTGSVLGLVGPVSVYCG